MMAGSTGVEVVSRETAGVVFGAPRRWLRVEALTLLIGSMIAYRTTHASWWLIVILFLAPDTFALGYLVNARLGARLYNLAHSTPLPATVTGLGYFAASPALMAIGLVGLVHIGVDRLVGYGLKYDDDDQHTHLGQLGRHRPW